MPNSDLQIDIRECTTADEFDACISLQREVFGLIDRELSPRRHFIVTMRAGGWTLGAFFEGKLIGFVLSVPAFRSNGSEERIFYSHMTAVKKEFQSHGIGARLKWAQRDRALAENIRFIKLTFEPVRARNAYFNLVRLGATVRQYIPNFYGTDYNTTPDVAISGFDSDRLVAEWQLDSEKVINASRGISAPVAEPAQKIVIPPDWRSLLINEPEKARAELLRIRNEFERAISKGLVCEGFERDEKTPAYLLF